MTIKIKIIIGFLFMVVLIFGLGALGYQKLDEAADSFQGYQRLAKLNAGTSDLTTAFGEMSTGIYRFLDSREARHMEEVRKSIGTIHDIIARLLPDVSKPDRKAALQKIDDEMQRYLSMSGQLQDSVLGAYAQFSDVVRKNMADMGDELLHLGTQAKSVNNSDMLYGLACALKTLSVARTRTALFSESRDLKTGEEAKAALNTLGDDLKNLEALVHSDEGKRIYTGLIKKHEANLEAFSVMVTRYQGTDKIVAQMRGMRESVTGAASKISADVNVEMEQDGAAMLVSESQGQHMMLIFIIADMAVAFLIAFFIIRGLILVLRNVNVFAGAVADGNFKYNLKVKEKGEIGDMVESMRRIPEVLGNLMNQTQQMANSISMGYYRNSIAKENFSGSFVELAEAVNFVGSTFAKLLDALPLPMMSCSKDNAILFLNQTAQTALGGNHIGSKCSGLLKAPECGNQQCFGLCAMSKNASHAGETTIHPQGKRMDITVAAMPLRDLAGTVTGYMEVLSDITEIKSKQETMERVTRQASEISDRVAAASEELSAQIEQISHGAEVQRDRVSSTATAMEEMNATVLEVARSAGQASEQSDSSRQKAVDGANLVNKVVDAINSVNAVAVTLQGNMQELGKLAEGIGGVMNVISDIADQTNLLALNAAIEAARAGDAGRGFAVVADEVRKLAEKTMHATQEVGTNITAIQGSTRTNIGEMGKAVENIDEATTLADSSGHALKAIVDLAAASSAVVTSIATAAEEQSATSEEINRAIEEINRVVGSTADGIVQCSAAVQELARMAQELRSVMASAN